MNLKSPSEIRKKITLGELATLVGGSLDGDPDMEIFGIASLEEAHEGEISFLAEMKNISRLEKTLASAIIAPCQLPPFPKPVIRTPNPYLAFVKVQAFFSYQPYSPLGIDSRACIGRGAEIGKDVSIYPYVYIGEESKIGDRVVLYPGVYIGPKVQVGEDSILYPNVVVMERCLIGRRVIIHAGTIIGSDGFGFIQEGNRHLKIPQVGIVQVDDDVEIGANCTIDRATMGKTWIKRGVKTDNLVHVAHNVVVGEDTLLVAQVGIAGSTKIGNRVALGGQVGVVGHINIGDDVKVGAQSGVAQDVPAGQIVSGTPAIPHRDWLRAQAIFSKLPEMKRTLSALEKRIVDLEEIIKGKKGPK
ncbi:MAG: UDP-3-O-(3-hydroxymyristoyl)glucosamine N-acyltransferase [Thermodesulfobacteriota bacterium]